VITWGRVRHALGRAPGAPMMRGGPYAALEFALHGGLALRQAVEEVGTALPYEPEGVQHVAGCKALKASSGEGLQYSIVHMS
jgi:hypothetical protein